MIVKFDTYNESVRDFLKPKPKEDIIASLGTLSPRKKYDKLITKGMANLLPKEEVKKLIKKYHTPEFEFAEIFNHKLKKYYTKKELKEILDDMRPYNKVEQIFYRKLQNLYTPEEIHDMIKELSPNEKVILGIDNDMIDLVREGLKRANKTLLPVYAARALMWSKIEITKEIVAKGANLENSNFSLCLGQACRNKKYETIEYLASLGIKVNWETYEYLEEHKQYKKVLEILKKYENVDIES